ncbi:cytochrome P450 7A1-like [Lineus longissimus]|uniref:cytochrome P450 7A1-like n=1 Tax=Lineus longissimus TaxID=88925 RepID=UPI00315DEAAA
MAAVLIWLTVFTGLAVMLVMRSLFRIRRKGEPPLVSGRLLWGNAAEFSMNAVKYLLEWRKEYGKVFTLRLINKHMTVIMDPHNYEAFSKVRAFDFDPIQKQVNLNVFSFVLKDARNMIKETGKTVRGHALQAGMKQFAGNLRDSCRDITSTMKQDHTPTEIGLRTFTMKTMFTAIFDTVFGKSNGHPFEPEMVYHSFEMYHRYFNYLWLGFPRALFPKAGKALESLLCHPKSGELLGREDCSDYIKYAVQYMLDRGQNEVEILGHNLVYLHVNYNTFRLSFWALAYLLEDPKSFAALRNEVRTAIEAKTVTSEDTALFSMKEVEDLDILNSVVQESFRLSSGVFMVRYINEDTWHEVDGKKMLFRQGDRVAIYPPAIHKDPEIFEDPMEFKYDRFCNEAKFYKDGRELKHPIMAFGSLCTGQRYATLQAKWYLMNIVNMFEINLLEGEKAVVDVQYHGHEILPPVNDVKCNFSLAKSFNPIDFSD